MEGGCGEGREAWAGWVGGEGGLTLARQQAGGQYDVESEFKQAYRKRISAAGEDHADHAAAAGGGGGAGGAQAELVCACGARERAGVVLVSVPGGGGARSPPRPRLPPCGQSRGGTSS